MNDLSNKGYKGKSDVQKSPALSILNPWIWLQFLRQTWINIKGSKVHYALGFIACFLAVMIVSVMVSLLNQTPVIFLRLSEASNAEIDVKLDAGSKIGFIRMNYTLVKELLTDPNEQYSSARVYRNAPMISSSNCPLAFSQDTSWLYNPTSSINDSKPCGRNCPVVNCPTAPYTVGRIFGIDFKREKEILLGRNWPLNEPLAADEVYVGSSLARSLNVGPGDYIITRLNVSYGGSALFNESVVQWACPQCASNITIFRDVELAWVKLRVKATFTGTGGKISRSESNCMLVDIHNWRRALGSSLNTNYFQITDELIQRFESKSVFDFVSTIVINLPPPRLSMYLNSAYTTIHSNLIKFSNKIFYKVGFAQVYVDLPVLRGLRGTETVSLFFGLILNVIIFILLFLSIVLIYSLLMISVETRTFEMGILRMIGMTRISMIALLLVQAFAYAIPAWLFGNVAALLVFYGLARVVSTLTGATISGLVSPTAFGLSTLIGLLIPVLAAILPIRSALSQNLQDSLDVKHNKTKAVAIDIKRSENFGAIPTTYILIGIGLSLFGALIYYVMPLGLLAMNLALMMNVFFFILIGMLLGLVMVALNLQHMIERFLCLVFFFWESRGIRNLVVKNLIAHRPRNQKTSILYALSLGFIIFINVAYQVQVYSISEGKKQEAGAAMFVEFNNRMTNRINHEYFENVKKHFPNVIDDYTWASRELRDSLTSLSDGKISNLGRWTSDTQRLRGVSPNFFRTCYSDFLIVDSQVDNMNIDARYLPDSLYTIAGSAKALIGSLYKSLLGISTSKTLLLEFTTGSTNSSTTDEADNSPVIDLPSGSNPSFTFNPNASASIWYTLQPQAIMDQAPFFKFSKFPLIRNQGFVMSMLSYLSFGHGQWSSVADIPMSHFLVKFKSSATEGEIDDAKSYLEFMAAASPGARVWDYREEMAPFLIANQAVFFFFTFTTVVAMAISFFSLMSSMFTNITEQTKEIGIVRALGIPKSWVYRIYIYEAFLLVIASSFLGVIIGTVTSYTMNSQQSLFTQLPLAFDFPWVLIFVVLGCSILFSFLSSFSPIRSVLGKRIVSIFRGQ